MKVKIIVEEVWQRTIEADIPEAEVREWVGTGKDAVLGGEDIKRFIEASADSPEEQDWHPKTAPGDDSLFQECYLVSVAVT